MDVAAESSLLNRSTFFTGSKRSFLVISHRQIRIPTKNFPRNLRFASRIPPSYVVPCTRSNFFSSRFQQNEGFIGRGRSGSIVAKDSDVHGVEDSVTSVKLGFLEVFVKRGIMLAAIVIAVLVFGCRRVFAVEGVVD